MAKGHPQKFDLKSNIIKQIDEIMDGIHWYFQRNSTATHHNTMNITPTITSFGMVVMVASR